MKTVYVDFKWNGTKKEKCKPQIHTVVAEYLSGAVRTVSGDVYQAIKSGKHNTTYVATL